ncbi:MAG: carbohydrate binding domain-containing protein [Deltaproteobacteria bacterium]|nr:carbohydrate binding domain-containing protein [Deltaproteobacteria bacterium]
MRVTHPRCKRLAFILGCAVLACSGGNDDENGNATGGGTPPNAGTIYSGGAGGVGPTDSGSPLPDAGAGGVGATDSSARPDSGVGDAGSTESGSPLADAEAGDVNSTEGGTDGSFESCIDGGSTSSSDSKNVIDNGDFTDGLTGWTNYSAGSFTVQSAIARSGSAAEVSGRVNTWDGPAQEITGEIAAGQTINVTAWVRIAGAASDSAMVSLRITYSDDTQEEYPYLGGTTANDTGWTLLSGAGTLNPTSDNVAGVTIYFQGPAAGVSLYVDDVAAIVSGPTGGTGTGDVGGGATVVIDPAVAYQTLEGFGAAVGWYGSKLTGHSKASELYAILFQDLGLDILRLRNRYDRKSTASNDEGSNWESLIADEDVKIFNGAKESLGHAPLVMLTSWSPPGTLKASGLERCSNNNSNNNTTCTLAKSNGAFDYAAFGKYWADSIGYYSGKGIAPGFISIQNEPDFVPGDWEGCKFTPSETAEFPGYDKALAAVHAALASDHPRILGPEVLGVHYSKVQNYAAALDASLLDGWAAHLYEQGNDQLWDWKTPGPDSFVAPMKGAASVSEGKPLFATEFATNEDNGTEGGFETAWLIHNTLAEANFAAFIYWDMIWTGNAGLVTINDTSSYTIRDQYFAMMHFSKFTNPGDKRILASSNLQALRASAWASKDGGQIALVLLNTGSSEKAVRLFNCGEKIIAKQAYRTLFNPGSSTRWQDITADSANGTVTMPARSVATVVLDE